MQHPISRPSPALPARTSALIGASACLLLALPASAAFDPNADSATPASISHNRSRLPDTSVLRDEAPLRPLYGTAPVAAPAAQPIIAAPLAGPAPSYISPLEPIKMPRPLYPSRANTPAMASPAPAIIHPVMPSPAVAAAPPVIVPTPVVVMPAPTVIAVPTMPTLPPVDPATTARAEAILRAEQSTPADLPSTLPASIPPAAVVVETPTAVGVPAPLVAQAPFIAPAPVFAREDLTPAPVPVAVVPVAPAPIVVAAPVEAPEPVNVPLAPPAVVVAAPAVSSPVVVVERYAPNNLSEQTRTILSDIPSKLDSPIAQPTSKVSLNRVSPQIQAVLGKEAQEENYESVGLSIKVRRPGLDTNYELNQAYTSLMGGDTERAIDIYKNILSAEPGNEDALFGLAATYHRLGQTQQARPFYGMLLRQNPNHREALNNFLVLVSDESPQDALPELERLELRNPDFSPIPAQIAIVLDKLGYGDQAENKMLRAIELAPDNLTYKYNLAIMLDRHRRYADASALYRMLIEASLRGEPVPAPVESMQKRLNYIATAMAQSRAGS